MVPLWRPMIILIVISGESIDLLNVVETLKGIHMLILADFPLARSSSRSRSMYLEDASQSLFAGCNFAIFSCSIQGQMTK